MTTPGSRRVEVLAELVGRCTAALQEQADHGGPSVDEHLDELRRTLARRRVPGAGHRARGVVTALRDGWPAHRPAPAVLVHDLRGVARALTSSRVVVCRPPTDELSRRADA